MGYQVRNGSLPHAQGSRCGSRDREGSWELVWEPPPKRFAAQSLPHSQLPISFLPPPDFCLLANPSPSPRADCREQGCHHPGPASRQTSDKRERDMRGCGREECGERPALCTVFTPCVAMAIVPFCTKLPGFRNSTSLSVCCCHSLSWVGPQLGTVVGLFVLGCAASLGRL